MPAPRAREEEGLRLHPQADPRHRDAVDGDAGGVHVQGRAQVRGAERPGRRGPRADGRARHPADDAGHPRERARQAGLHGAPRPLRRHRRTSTRTRAWSRSGSSSGFVQRGRARSPRTCWGTGLIPQVPINDKKMYPIYAKCVELDVPIIVYAGVPGSAHPDEPAGRRAARRGVLVLPRAQDRHAPRRGAVDRADGEAAAEVAEPLLLDERVRAEALPEGHHRLREHARRRQDPVRGLLLRRPRPRPHLLRAAERAVPRPRLAQVPARERGPGLRARGPVARR